MAEACAALFAGALVVTLVSLIGEPNSTQPDLRPTSYSAGKGGLFGLHEVLRACDVATDRVLTSSPDGAPPADTLVVAAPTEAFAPADIDALFEWVASGGRLVVAAAPSVPPLVVSHHAPLLERVGLRARRQYLPPRATSIADGSALPPELELEWSSRQVLEDTEEGVNADARAGAAEPLVAARLHTVVARVPFGDAGGDVIAIADASILTNEVLRKGDDALLAVTLLVRPDAGDGRVLFDEYHHGYRPDGASAGVARRALALLVTTWPGRAVLLVALAWLVFLAGAGVRLGAPLPPEAPPRRALSEHVDALGRLLSGARARTEALRMAAAGARRAVGPRAGLSPALAPEAFRARLAASPAPGAAELAQALESADRLVPRGDGEFVEAAHALGAARRRYLHGGS